jgi:hypothetical protein
MKMKMELKIGGGRPQGLPVRKHRLPVQTVERLHRVLGGDARLEEMILQFIAVRYAAQDLLQLPPHVASAILKRPADFLAAVKLLAEGNQ